METNSVLRAFSLFDALQDPAHITAPYTSDFTPGASLPDVQASLSTSIWDVSDELQRWTSRRVYPIAPHLLINVTYHGFWFYLYLRENDILDPSHEHFASYLQEYGHNFQDIINDMISRFPSATSIVDRQRFLFRLIFHTTTVADITDFLDVINQLRAEACDPLRGILTIDQVFEQTLTSMIQCDAFWATIVPVLKPSIASRNRMDDGAVRDVFTGMLYILNSVMQSQNQTDFLYALTNAVGVTPSPAFLPSLIIALRHTRIQHINDELRFKNGVLVLNIRDHAVPVIDDFFQLRRANSSLVPIAAATLKQVSNESADFFKLLANIASPTNKNNDDV